MSNSSFIEHLIDRRQAFQTFAGLGAGAIGIVGLPSDADASAIVDTRLAIDFSDPVQNLDVMARVLGHLDPEVETFSWYGGHIFSMIKDQAPKPIIGVDGFGVMRIQPQSNGVYRIFNRELAFYKNPQTEEILDVWHNPFTDEDVEVMPIHNFIVNAEVAPIQKMDLDGTMIEIPFNPPWWLIQDTAFSVFEIHAAFPSALQPDKWPRESAGPITRVSEIFQRSSPLDQVQDLGRPSIDYVGAWTRVGPWLPWMLMGQAEGYLHYRTFMKKLRSIDDIPKTIRARAEKDYPDFFEAPGLDTWGQPNNSSWSVFMEERSPAPPKE